MITLEFLCGQKMTAEIRRKIDRAVNKAYLNIMDNQTDEKEKRVVTLKIVMKPDHEAEMIEVTAEVTAKTAQEKALGTFCQMDPDQIMIDGVERMYSKINQETGEIEEDENE